MPGTRVSAYQTRLGAEQVIADEQGRFLFQELPDGHFRVSARAPGYNETVLDDVPHGSTEIRLDMLPLSRVIGQVIEADSGLPITEFDVLSTEILPADSTHWQKLARADGASWHPVLDATGKFVLAGVTSEKAVAIGARAAGFVPAYVELAPLAPGETSPLVTLALHWAAGVEGLVVDASSRPIAGVAIHFGDDERKPVAAITDPDGRFRLGDLAPSSIPLTLTHPDFVDQTLEITPTDPPLDLAIVLAQGGQVEGMVTMADDAVPDALVVAGSLGRDGFQQTTRTNDAGEFWLAGLKPGIAEVFVDLPPSDETEEPAWRLQQRILIEEDAVTSLEFRFPEMASTLEGFIRIGSQVAASASLRGTTVGDGGDSFFSAVTEADGSYQVGRLMPGDAWIEVVASTSAGAERRHGFSLAIPEGAVIRHDIVLAGTGVLTGSLLGLSEGETGEVMILPANIAVDITDREAMLRLQQYASARAMLQPDGGFRVEGLEPGGYTLLAVVFRPDAEDDNETDVLSTVRLESTPVFIQAGKVVRISLHP